MYSVILLYFVTITAQFDTLYPIMRQVLCIGVLSFMISLSTTQPIVPLLGIIQHIYLSYDRSLIRFHPISHLDPL